MMIVINRLQRAMSLTLELFESLQEDELDLRLSNLPSNSIRSQYYCILGARESYYRAIITWWWQGFSCSLDKESSKDKYILALKKSEETILSFDWGDIDLLFDLLEHEIQHHGQLIRYIYWNKLEFPKSWNDRYTV